MENSFDYVTRVRHLSILDKREREETSFDRKKQQSKESFFNSIKSRQKTTPTTRQFSLMNRQTTTTVILAIQLCMLVIIGATQSIDQSNYSTAAATTSKLINTNDAVRNSFIGPKLSAIYGSWQNSDKIISLLNNVSHEHNNTHVDLETATNAWLLMQSQTLNYMEKRVNEFRPIIVELLNEANVTSDCQGAIGHWMDSLVKLDQWAVLMWNSWGQFPSAGLYEGSFTDLGSYRSCLRAEDNEFIGQAKYCTIDYQPIVPKRPRFHGIFKKVLDVDGQGTINGGDVQTDKRQVQVKQRTALNETLHAEALVELLRKAQYFYYVKFRIGTCFPSKCSTEDVQRLAQTVGQRMVLQSTPVNCLKKEPTTINTHQMVAIIILSSLALIALTGTLFDLLGFTGACKVAIIRNLLLFSIWTNLKRLFDTDSGSTNDLACLHGLRFFSMCWVIYGHTILFTEYQSFTHFFSVVENDLANFLLLPTFNANFSVDTFFVMSGILTSYVTYQLTQGDPRRFNKLAFAISRYVRLTPQLVVVILCFFLLPLMGDGPLYKSVTGIEANKCFKNWWVDLLYIQTYFNFDEMCIIPSWWLSIEMFFHLMSIVVIIAMLKDGTTGLIVNFVIATALTLYGSYIHYTSGFPIQFLPSTPQKYEVIYEQAALFFHRPYPHAASYAIGIALGYVLANKRIKKITKSQVRQGWLMCAMGLITVLWGCYPWNLGAPYNQLESTLYYNLCQIIWPLCVAWMIFACALGQGGPIDKILSARIFIPLGRITYMTYLSHSLVIYYFSGSTNIQIEPSMMFFVYIFISNTFISMILGTLLTVVYESPFLSFQKLLFNYLAGKFDPVPQSPPLPAV